MTACILVAWAFLAIPASPVGYENALNPSKADQAFRDTLQDFTLHEFVHFRGLGNVTAAGTVLIASVGAVMTTVLTGQLVTVTSAAIRLVFPQLPVPPDTGPH